MRRVERLQSLYESAIADLTRSGNAWTDFLSFAASIYKYSFDNMLLIYSQNPEATMLAPLPVWNKIGRYVKKGEKSIAVCDFGQDNLVLNHLFDITQTTGKAPPVLWNLEQIDLTELAGRLSSYETHNISVCISNMAKDAVISSMDEVLQDWTLDMQDHFFDMLPATGFEQHMQDIIQDSVVFLVHRRCKLPEPERMDFSTIVHFDSLPLAARLGHQVTTVSRDILQDIARHVKILTNERRIYHEQQQVQLELSRDRRPSVSRPANLEPGGSRPAAAGQVRPDGAEFPPQSSPAALPDSQDARQSDEKNAPSRAGSPREDGHIDQAAYEAPPHAADGRHLGADTPPQSDQSDRRGTGPERHHTETAITTFSSDPEPPTSGSFFCPERNTASKKRYPQITCWNSYCKAAEADQQPKNVSIRS